MPKNTSESTGDHFDSFIAKQMASGHYGSVNEEQKLATLRTLIEEGVASGVAEYNFDLLMNELG